MALRLRTPTEQGAISVLPAAAGPRYWSERGAAGNVGATLLPSVDSTAPTMSSGSKGCPSPRRFRAEAKGRPSACLWCVRNDRRYPAAMSTPPLSGQDLRAAAEVHRELGSDYGDAVIDSFLEKVEARLGARVEARLAELTPPRKRRLASLSSDQRRKLLARVAVGVGGVGVPLSLMAYNATWYMSGQSRDFWAALLVTSAGTCGAGLSRMLRGRR
jgi:hypothetical protein